MSNRLNLHNLLVSIAGPNVKVYFQPPESIKMSFPAIVYTRSDIRNNNANNIVYTQNKYYQITVIDKDPESVLVEKVSKIPKVRFDRHFTSDNLNHDVFTLYYDNNL